MTETQVKISLMNSIHLECYLFPNEIESFLSENEHSATINVIYVNIKGLYKTFHNLLDILTLFVMRIWIPPPPFKRFFYHINMNNLINLISSETLSFLNL